jgi:hypothetical protein
LSLLVIFITPDYLQRLIHIAACILATQWFKIILSKGALMNIALIGLGMVVDARVAAIKSSSDRFNLPGALWCDSVKIANLPDENTIQASDCIFEIYQVKSTDFVVLATPPNVRRKVFETLAVADNPILMKKPIDRNISVAVQND